MDNCKDIIEERQVLVEQIDLLKLAISEKELQHYIGETGEIEEQI